MRIIKQTGPIDIETMTCLECNRERLRQYEVVIGGVQLILCHDCLADLREAASDWVGRGGT